VPIPPSQWIIWQKDMLFINDFKRERRVGATSTAMLAVDRN
jgi:hypothetical protein